ncbi:MAG: rod shape-determining protein MreC [Flavobacteriaceae bacterium]|nr:rod shape-determining protein MreC [Flavobacteriaceae bacterium]
MLVIFRWIRNQAYPLLFALLFLSAWSQILRFHLYQQSIYFNQSLGFYRQIDSWKSDITQYFGLQEKNQELIYENQLLKDQLNWNLTDYSPKRNDSYLDSITNTIVKYEYIKARVIRNSVGEQNNFIVLDQGYENGVKQHMSVVSPIGIIGIVVESTAHYSLVMSVLNSKFEITPYFKELKASHGVINWNGEDPRYVELEEVNRFVKVKNGMQLFTSNYSLIFPAGIPIGTIVKSSSNLKANFFTIKVKLATDFSKIDMVSVVKNIQQEEIDQLDNSIPTKDDRDN